MAAEGRPDWVLGQSEDDESATCRGPRAWNPLGGESASNHTLTNEDPFANNRKESRRIGYRIDACTEGNVVSHGDPNPKKPEDGGHVNARPGPQHHHRNHSHQSDCSEEPLHRPRGDVAVTRDAVEMLDRGQKPYSPKA